MILSRNPIPFVCLTFIVLFIYNVNSMYKNDFERRLHMTNMCPEIVHYFPKYIVNVTWNDTGVSADIGNIIPYAKVRNKPEVRWPCNETSYYSLIFTDYNDSTKWDRHLMEYQLWFVCNIPGNDIEKGEEQLPYILPDPVKGPHYVGVAVFEQDSKRNMSDPEWMEEYVRPNRSFFAAMEIAFDFGGIVHAANVYQVSPPTEGDLQWASTTIVEDHTT